jgi:serralysin
VGRGRDTIHDVVSGVDLIDLSAIDPQAGVVGDQAFRWGAKSAAAFSVWAVASRGDLLLRADVSGDRVPEFEVRLAGLSGLSFSDLVL